jgi:hypothetical protein
MIRRTILLPILAVVALLLCCATLAHAQGMMPAPAPKPKGAAPKVNPDEPVTHAASGATDESMRIGGTEPTLPANPLEVTPELKLSIGTDADRERVKGRGKLAHRLWLGPWYEEQSGNYSFKTLFPLWAERKQPEGDRASLFGMLYYNRRSPEHDADVLFPLFWNLRDGKQRTTVVGPVVRRTSPDATDTWALPLFLTGWRKDDGGYLHIPPLLTFTTHTKDTGFSFSLGYFCSWKGSSSCSPSRATDIDYGFAPLLFFAGKSERSRYEFAAPLLHYYHYDDLEDSSINIWGPLIWGHNKDSDAFDVFPIYWRNWGKNEDHLTVFPIFHYGYKGNSNLLVTPAYIRARGEKGEQTDVVPGLFSRYSGRTKLLQITPFFWKYEDPDIGLDRLVIPPFWYSSISPRGSDIALFPFFAHSIRPQIRETTWITPFFSHTHDLTGWETNIYPFLFTGRTYDSTHTVLFPFFWDFASPKARSTVVLPVLWRFSDQSSVSQLTGNVYYHERKLSTGLDWEVHIFPAFSYGETPDGHWWNIFYGLAGYTRHGAYTKMRMLYVPITLSGSPPEETPAPPSE